MANYTCRKCRQPLELDASLTDLTPSSYDLLASSIQHPPIRIRLSEKDKLEQVPASPSVRDAWKRTSGSQLGHPSATSSYLSARAQGKQPQRSLAGAPNESFVFLQDSVVQRIPSSATAAGRTSASKGRETSGVKPISHSTDNSYRSSSPMSSNVKSTTKLFSLLSTKTDIDHPLCTECTDSLLKYLSEQLKDTMRERDGYIAFEKELKKERAREEEPVEDIERRIERLKEEEKLAIEDLREAQREKEQLERELLALELEEKELEEEEAEYVLLCLSFCCNSWFNRFWIAHNMHLLTSAEQASQLASLRAAYTQDSLILEKLEHTNVYNDAFCIGHDGVFGTINGLRLGRVSGVHVRMFLLIVTNYPY